MNTTIKQTPFDLMLKIVLGSGKNVSVKRREIQESTHAEELRAFLNAKLGAGYKLLQYPDRNLLIAEDGKTIYQLKGSTNNGVSKTISTQKREYGYPITSISGKGIYVHRLVGTAHNETIPVGMTVDHIDGDHENNHIDNLQLLTQAANSRKGFYDTLRKHNATSLKGINNDNNNR